MKNKKKASRPSLQSVEEAQGGNASPFACMVPGCRADVPEHLQYSRRRRICQEHLKAPAVAIDGQAHRFCQQCGRFQLLSEFSDERRSCDAALRAHNARRRITWTSRKTQPSIAKHSTSHGVAKWNDLLSAGLQQAPWFPAAHQPHPHSMAMLAGGGSSSSAAAGARGSSGQQQILLQQLAWQQLQQQLQLQLQQQQQVLYAQQQFGKCLPQLLAQPGAAQVDLSTASPAVAVSRASAAGAMTAPESGQLQQPQHVHSAHSPTTCRPPQGMFVQQQRQPPIEVACRHSWSSSGVGYTDMQHAHCLGPAPSTHSPSVGSTDSTDDVPRAAADTHGLQQQQQQQQHPTSVLAAAGASEQGTSQQRSAWQGQCMPAQPSGWLQQGLGSLQGLQQVQDNSRSTQTPLQPQQLQQVQILQQLQSDQGTAHLDTLAPVQPSELCTRSSATDTPEPACEPDLELSCNSHIPAAQQPLWSAAGPAAASEPHAGLIAAGKACATGQGRDAAPGPSSAGAQETSAVDQPPVGVLGHDLLPDLEACVDAFDIYDLARLDSSSLASFGAIDDLAATTAAAGHEDQLFTEQVISALLDDGFDDMLSPEPGMHPKIGDFKF